MEGRVVFSNVYVCYPTDMDNIRQGSLLESSLNSY